jgi:predicted metal-dependent HD superfamily phosphohydrolase
VQPGDLDRLRSDWESLLDSLGAEPNASRIAFTELVASYASPGRYYHTLDHIGQVLRDVHQLQDQTSHPAAVLLAAWFHDAVYDPRAADNEEQSARYAETVLRGLAVPYETVRRVATLILQTKTHAAGHEDPDGPVLLDADLAILGAPADEYARYAAAIRQEYSWVPEAVYRSKRAAILQGFLQRPRIYRTRPMFEKSEITARRNLQGEIESITQV